MVTRIARQPKSTSLSLPFAMALLLVIACGANFGCDHPQPKIPAIVVGGSMAPTLHGEHLETVCPNCEFIFQTDAVESPHYRWLFCPNCTQIKIPIADAQKRDAETCQILPDQPIRRWDLVAFRLDEKRNGIKRVIGLPGELVTLSDGEVRINDRMSAKSISLQREMAIPVFDSKFVFVADSKPKASSIVPESSTMPQRGFSSRSENWVLGKTLQFSATPKPKRSLPASTSFPNPATDQTNDYHWAIYNHLGGNRSLTYSPDQSWPNRAEVLLTRDQLPFELISDTYGYNQKDRRQPNFVNDLLISMEITLSTQSQFAIQISGEFQQTFEIDMRSGNMVARYQTVSAIPTSAKNKSTDRKTRDKKPENGQRITRQIDPGKRHHIEVSNIDCHLTVCLDGKRISRQRIPGSTAVAKTERPQISLGARNGDLTLHRIRIKRDLHYLPWNRDTFDDSVFGQKDSTGAESQPINRQYQLGEDEYFVLGDNVWLSKDSRTWAEPGLKRASIIGRVEKTK